MIKICWRYVIVIIDRFFDKIYLYAFYQQILGHQKLYFIDKYLLLIMNNSRQYFFFLIVFHTHL